MTKRWLFGTLFAAAFCAGTTSAHESQISVVAVIPEIGSPSVTVTLSRECRKDDQARIAWPTGLVVREELATKSTVEPNEQCNGIPPVRTYRSQIEFGLHDENSGASRPIAGDGYVFLFGSSLFPTAANKFEQYKVTLQAERSQIITNFGIWENSSQFSFADGAVLRNTFVFAGPEVRYLSRDVEGVPISIGYIPKFTSQQFLDELFARYSYLLKRFDQHKPSSLYVAVVPTDEGDWGPFFQGTALPNGVVLQTSAPDPSRWEHELTHELLHEWLPLRMGGLRPQKDYSDGYIFTEGYTEYLTYLFNIEMGRGSIANFIEKINEALIDQEFEQEQFATDPYQSGLLHGFFTDLMLAEESKSNLVSHLKRLVHIPKNARHDHFDAYVRLSDSLSREGFQAFPLTEIPPVPGATDYSEFCMDLRVDSLFRYEAGFDFDVLENGGYLIKQVDEASRAYAAGLREGMIILERIAGDKDDMNSLATFRVRGPSGESTISFYPKTKEARNVRQIWFDSSRRDRLQCEENFRRAFIDDRKLEISESR